MPTRNSTFAELTLTLVVHCAIICNGMADTHLCVCDAILNLAALGKTVYA